MPQESSNYMWLSKTDSEVTILLSSFVQLQSEYSNGKDLLIWEMLQSLIIA